MVMMFRVFSAVLCSLLCLSSVMQVRASYADTYEIAAVVNDDAISVHDLEKRMRLMMASSGLPNNNEIRQRIMSQVLGGLVNEAIMLQEAKQLDLSVELSEVEEGFATIAQQNQQDPKVFKAMLQRGGIDVSTMYDQVRAQIAWSKVVQKKLRPKVIVSERDIDAAYERIRSKIGTSEYLAAEIFLPFHDVKSENDAKKLSDRLVREIRGGKASFFKLAQQFSSAAGAMDGGDTGWINQTQIDQEILDGLKALKKNQVSSPIKTLNGYHILFLRDVRTLSEDTLPSKNQIEYDLGSQRLQRIQNRHLFDLKSASFIDVRL